MKLKKLCGLIIVLLLLCGCGMESKTYVKGDKVSDSELLDIQIADYDFINRFYVLNYGESSHVTHIKFYKNKKLINDYIAEQVDTEKDYSDVFKCRNNKYIFIYKLNDGQSIVNIGEMGLDTPTIFNNNFCSMSGHFSNQGYTFKTDEMLRPYGNADNISGGINDYNKREISNSKEEIIMAYVEEQSNKIKINDLNSILNNSNQAIVITIEPIAKKRSG